jgi:hypothetical protein
MTIAFGTDDLVTDAAAMLGFLQAYAGGGTGGTGGGVPPANFFPADPATAPFPSPENSQQLILNGVVSGAPYLRASDGRVHELKVIAGASEYWINGASQMDGWSGHADSPPAQTIVRQGGVYVVLTSGAVQQQNANGFRNTPLPPASTGGGGGTGPILPPLPAFPTPSPVAPGSSGRIINCGTGQALATLSAAIPTAQAGDTIKLAPGTYTDAPPHWAVPLLIDLGGATLDMAGNTGSLAFGKGCLVPGADSIIQNGTIVNTAMDQGRGQLTSAIRPDDGCGYLTIIDMIMHDNQCGVGHGGSPVVIEVRNTDISNNGLVGNAGANTHNLYVGQACRRLTLNQVVSNGCKDAHAIKYRGPELISNGGTFAASNGSCFDLPDGSTVPFQITGATMNKAAADGDHHVMGLGEESQSNGSAGGFINGGTINALCPNPFIAGTGTITMKGVTEPVKVVGESAALVIVRTA